MSRGNLGLWICAGVLLGVTAQAGAQDATSCESDDACAQGTFCSGEGYDGGGSEDDLGDDDDGDGSGDSTDGASNESDAPEPPAIIPGQCVPLLTGFCENGAGCADGLICSSGSSSPDGCDDGGGDDGDSNTGEPSDPPVPGCELVEDRYGSCQLPEVECASDDDCGAGLRCVVTGGSGGCDDEGCEFEEYKSCVYEAQRCDDAPCSAGYDCVAQTVPGECTGSDGGCDETGCWTEEGECEPDTIEKVCLIAYRACDEAACADGEACLAFSGLDGDLSVPEHWGVEGPVKSCVPADSVLVAQTAQGLPEAGRNVSDAPGWGGGDDSDGDIEDEGPIDDDPSTGDDGVGGDDGGDAEDDGPTSPTDDEPTSDDDPGVDPGDGSPDGSDDDGPKGSSCSVGFAGNDVSSLASILLALGLTVRRRRRR